MVYRLPEDSLVANPLFIFCFDFTKDSGSLTLYHRKATAGLWLGIGPARIFFNVMENKGVKKRTEYLPFVEQGKIYHIQRSFDLPMDLGTITIGAEPIDLDSALSRGLLEQTTQRAYYAANNSNIIEPLLDKIPADALAYRVTEKGHKHVEIREISGTGRRVKGKYFPSIVASEPAPA